MFANTAALIENARTAGNCLYALPTTPMNKLQKMLTRRAYLQGVTISAKSTKAQVELLGYKVEREEIVSAQMTLEDNNHYNKVLFGN